MSELTENNFNLLISRALDETKSNMSPFVFYFREKIIELQRDWDLAKLELDRQDVWIENYKDSIRDESMPRSSGDYHRLYDNLETLIKERETFNEEVIRKENILKKNQQILELMTEVVGSIAKLRSIEDIKDSYISGWWIYEFIGRELGTFKKEQANNQVESLKVASQSEA